VRTRRKLEKPFQRFPDFAPCLNPTRCVLLAHVLLKYIANQEEHHRKKSFAEEFKLFVKRYELQWYDD